MRYPSDPSKQLEAPPERSPSEGWGSWYAKQEAPAKAGVHGTASKSVVRQVRGTVILAITLVAITLVVASPSLAQGPPTEMINSGTVARVVTPTDNVPLALGATRLLFVGNTAACNLAVILLGDTTAVTFTNVPPTPGFIPLRAKVVMATNTTCTNIMAVY